MLGLAHAVRGLRSLRYFSLAGNQVENSGLVALLEAVGEGRCPAFQRCSFAENVVDDRGLDEVCKIVLTSPAIALVNLEQNKLSSQRKKEVWREGLVGTTEDEEVAKARLKQVIKTM